MMVEELLVRCWKCDKLIDLESCKGCTHSEHQTRECPYCGECLCNHPKFHQGLRRNEVVGHPTIAWTTGKRYKATEVKP